MGANVYLCEGANQPGYCGADDCVDDTPLQDIFSFEQWCDTLDACVAGSGAAMTMNYMGYGKDSCKNIFTKGQALRMRAALEIARPGILNNCYCNEPTYDISGITITNDTTWDSDLTIIGRVIVAPGATLTINNGARLQFADTKRTGINTGMHIKAGAKLVVDNATLTVLSCDRMWDGINVSGDHDKDQVPVFNNQDHGLVELRNNAVIEHARVGVALKYPVIISQAPVNRHGGIIRATNCIFRNNRISIDFGDYIKFLSKSQIINCTFECTDVMRDRWTYPNEGPLAFIRLNSINGAKFYGSSFMNTRPDKFDYNKRGIGIRSYNSYFIVDADTAGGGMDSTLFTGLYKGIETYSLGGPIPAIVKYADFKNNIKGIVTNGSLYDEFILNTFHIPPNAQLIDLGGGHGSYYTSLSSTWGIFTYNSKSVKIAGNSFLGDTILASYNGNYAMYGTITRNSGIGGGAVYLNEYSTQDFATQTEHNNPNLMIKCNDYQSYEWSAWMINPELSPYYRDIIADQGSGCLPGETAGNMFIDLCNIGEEIWALVEFDYFGNGNPIETVPVCSNNKVNLTNCMNSYPVDTIATCPSITACIYCPPKTTSPYSQSPALQNAFAAIMAIANPVEKQFHFNNLVRQLVLWDNEGAAIDVLEEWDTLPNKKILVAAYLDNKDYTAARAALSQIPQDSTEEIKFHQLYDILLDIGESDRDIWDITEEEKQIVMDIAGSSTEVSTNAASVLALIDGGIYDREPQKYQQQGAKRKVVKSIPDKITSPYFTVFPNPVKGHAVIRYNLPEHCQDAKIVVYDITGRILIAYELDGSNNEIIVNTNEYSNGIYIYSLLLDHQQVMNKSIAIIKD